MLSVVQAMARIATKAWIAARLAVRRWVVAVGVCTGAVVVVVAVVVVRSLT
jgi:hypothetical protein